MEIYVTRSCVRNHFGEAKTEASEKPVLLLDPVKQARFWNGVKHPRLSRMEIFYLLLSA
jgi:hypothetical protein